jgi:glycosyltransferase involved in cell wall biosynthesis
MKILFLNYEYPPLGGGAGNATSYLLREFSKIPGLEVDLVTSSVDQFRVEKPYPNINIHYLNIGKKGNLHFQSNLDLLKYSWAAYRYSKKLLKNGRYDLCQAFFGIPCGFIAWLLGVPYTVSLRGSDVPFYNNRFYILDKLLFQHLSRLVWKNSRSVVALSDDLRKLAHRTRPEQEIKIIYNGIDFDEFRPVGESMGSDFNILFVGRLIERKGLVYLLEAMKNIAVKYPRAKIIIAGDGPLLAEHKKFCVDNKIANRVDFKGIVPHKDIWKIFGTSHVFVLPSLNEALGNVTQEALAAGLPIITTDTGAAELLDENGYVVQKKSARDIEGALIKLLENEGLRRQMAEKSRQIALEMKWENVAKKYYDLYRDNITKR